MRHSNTKQANNRPGTFRRNPGFSLAVRMLLLGCLLPLSEGLSANAQPSRATNRVLQLDGTNSFVQLPPNSLKSGEKGSVSMW